MADELVMGLVGGRGLQVVSVTAGGVAREARRLHGAGRAAAALLGEGFVAAEFLSALQLQKSSGRVNLQLECDGPLRGLFVESDGTGALRGYAKNPLADVEGHDAHYRWRPALGNSGYLSILRDRGEGEFFRSSVELEAFDVARDLERYFAISDQIPTALAIEVVPAEGDPLGVVGGALAQLMPGGDAGALAALRRRWVDDGGLRALLSSGSSGVELLRAFAGEEVEITSRYALAWHCPCSKERVVRALATLGRAELEDMLHQDGSAEASCHFCTTRYVVSAEELRALLDAAPPHESC